MRLDLEPALEAPVALSHRFDLSPAALERPELVSLSTVEFTGHLQKSDPGFLLEGTVGIRGLLTCVRCLTEFPFASEPRVSWNLAPLHRRHDPVGPIRRGSPPPPPKAPLPDDDEDGTELALEDLDVVFYEDMGLELDPLIEEQVQLTLPMKPLCKEKCRGLCPQCGADRNTTTCACQEPRDERWTPLQALAKRQ